MLYLINPQFMNVETSTVTDKDNTLIKYRFKTLETVSVKTKKPFFRYLATLTGDTNTPIDTDFAYMEVEDFNVRRDGAGLVSSVVPNETKPGQNSVYIRTIKDGEDRDDTTVVIMAIPFSGILKQIPKSKDYRILTGCIVRSSEGITFEDKEYTSVLYLVMTMNPALYDKNHRHHIYEASITVDAYQIPSGTSGDIECSIDSMKITFSEDAVVSMTKSETLDCQINVEEVLGIHPTWFTYKPAKKADASKDKKSSKPSKEFQNAANKSETKLDEMIKKSNQSYGKGNKNRSGKYFNGFEESFDDGRPKSKRNKGKNGKNNKKRRNDFDYD